MSEECEKITVYTATYNRKELLAKVYASLEAQTNKNFIWLVIDDGSEDGTCEVVAGWKENSDFEINYFFKENGGIHSVRNIVCDLIDTELYMSVDSDDYLVPNAIEVVLGTWNSLGSKKYAGMIALNMSSDGKVIGDMFPNLLSASYQEIHFKYRVKGDKSHILRRSIMAKVEKAPIYKNEKLVGESYRLIQIPDDHPFLIINKAIRVRDYIKGGYTASSKLIYFQNPNGLRDGFYKGILMTNYGISIKIKNYLGYIILSYILKDKYFMGKLPNKILGTVLKPIGRLIYLYLSYKYKK